MKKILTLIIVVLVLLGGYCLIFAYMMAYKGPKIKLSIAERNFIKTLTQECNCKVGYRHNYSFIKAGVGYSRKDSTQWISLESEIDKIDFCQRDSISMILDAKRIANKLTKIMSYKNYYTHIGVSYYTTDDLDEVERKDLCKKIVLFKIDKNGELTFVDIKNNL